MHKIQELVSSVSGRIGKSGYPQLIYAVYLTCDYLPKYPRFTKDIYPQVAAYFSMRTSAVSKAICRACQDCWDYGNRKRIEEIAGRPLVEKPAPRELILYFAMYYMNQDISIVS